MFIACRNLTFQYPKTETDVFRNLNWRITEPGFHALFGLSGVGKTTLAKIVTGEIPAPDPAMIERGEGNILFSYNLERLPGWYSIQEHLRAVIPPTSQDTLDELVSLFGLDRCLEARFANVSLGQQNRVNLLRYLLQDFTLLIMDECLANVDETTRETIILEIKKRFPEKCFVYISHNVHEVSKLCDHIWVLRQFGRKPRLVTVEGQDYCGESLAQRNLEKTMLEVVHAA